MLHYALLCFVLCAANLKAEDDPLKTASRAVTQAAPTDWIPFKDGLELPRFLVEVFEMIKNGNKPPLMERLGSEEYQTLCDAVRPDLETRLDIDDARLKLYYWRIARGRLLGRNSDQIEWEEWVDPPGTRAHTFLGSPPSTLKQYLGIWADILTNPKTKKIDQCHRNPGYLLCSTLEYLRSAEENKDEYEKINNILCIPSINWRGYFVAGNLHIFEQEFEQALNEAMRREKVKTIVDLVKKIGGSLESRYFWTYKACIFMQLTIRSSKDFLDSLDEARPGSCANLINFLTRKIAASPAP